MCIKSEKPVYDWLLVIGPGGIRTHDQGIMSPLRYRCATGPLCATFIKFFGLAVSTSFHSVRYLPLLRRYLIVFVGRVPQIRFVLFYLNTIESYIIQLSQTLTCIMWCQNANKLLYRLY